jgi:DNA (cytosine-5)-methyltransferase 1
MKYMKRSGFNIVWANEYDPTIWETFEYNFPNTKLDKRSIVNVPSSEIPKVDGIIGSKTINIIQKVNSNYSKK